MNPTDFLEGSGPGAPGLNMIPATVAATTAVVCALTSELIIWYLIYRHDDYKKLCNDFEDQQAKLD